MKNEEMLNLINKPLPAPHIANFTYISTRKSDIDQWLTDISVLNVAEVSKQLRTTLFEIAYFQSDAGTKLEMMEAINISVDNLIKSLGRRYLNQKLVLDESAMAVANLVQELRGYKFAIYKNIVMTLLQAQKNKKVGITGIFTKLDNKPGIALYRAITALVDIIYESNLLYLPPLEGVWQNLHKLYLIAEGYRYLDTKVTDHTLVNENVKLSVKDAYLRGVLLSVCRTNSLRQQEIHTLYGYTELWCHLLQQDKSPSSNDIFVIDFNSDREPSYITTEQQLSTNLEYINATHLLKHIKHIQKNDSDFVDNAESQLFQSSLLDYIVKSIEEPLERTTARHPFEGKMFACIGVFSCHYHLAGGYQFSEVIKLKELIKEQDCNDLLVSKFNQHNEDIGFSIQQEQSSVNVDTRLLQLGKVKIVDISPGGYKVAWEGESAPFLKTGELICLREDDKKPWQIGVIRWVQQKPAQGADLGVEILASKATACGVKPANYDESQDDYLRGIILPEVKSLNRAATILIPNYQFKPNHKIEIRRGTASVRAKLGKQYMKTQSFQQYDFTVVSSVSK